MTAQLVKTTTRTRYAQSRKGKPIKLRVGGKPAPRSDRVVPLATIRCNELDRFFDDRYGPVLPDDDAGRDDAVIMLHHLAFRQAIDRQLQMNDWLDRRAPWLAGRERDSIIAKLFRKPILFKPDTLAGKIGLTYARRQRLGITTIGAIDMPAEARKELRKEKARSRKAAARRAAGRMPRAEYEGQSIAKVKPWEAEGISRRTWYR
jgi:hypothetical protein